MPASMKDVAEAASVSIKTVSNVVNGRPNVGAATRARVLAVMEQLDFRHNPLAQSLRSGRTGIISVVAPALDQPYFGSIVNSIIGTASSLGLTVVVELTGGDPERELAVLNSRRRMTDGTILIPIGLASTGAGHIDVTYPLVVLGDPIAGSNAEFVAVQGAEAARAATSMLLERGRRRVAAVGVRPDGDDESRLRGYLSALEDHGIPADPALLVPVKSWHRSAGVEGITALLDSGAPFDAVFAFNDALALGVMHGLQARGITIPDQVAVLGFDDIEEARYTTPSLSSVDPGYAHLARTAVARLISLISDEPLSEQPPRTPFRVVERASTGAIPRPRRASDRMD